MRADIGRMVATLGMLLTIALAERARADGLDCPTAAFAQRLGPVGWQLVCGGSGCPEDFTCRPFLSFPPPPPEHPELIVMVQECYCQRGDGAGGVIILGHDSALCTVTLVTTISPSTGISTVEPVCKRYTCATHCWGPELPSAEYHCACDPPF